MFFLYNEFIKNFNFMKKQTSNKNNFKNVAVIFKTVVFFVTYNLINKPKYTKVDVISYQKNDIFGSLLIRFVFF